MGVLKFSLELTCEMYDVAGKAEDKDVRVAPKVDDLLR